MRGETMILSAFFFNPQGDHRMSWRHPSAPSGDEILHLDYYRELVTFAEAAKVDAIFIADHLGIWDSYPSGVAHYANARLEPLTLVAALAATTKDIGFLVTASTSYSEPYSLARMFASLDHLSGGRVGWNVVTSALTEEARNFGRDANAEHGQRYQRADEFLQVTKALWDSWEDGAMVANKATGLFAQPDQIHNIDHRGTHFQVKGPLNISRPPQGHPVIVQAGSSEAGKQLASRYADIHFAVVKTIEDGQTYRADLKRRAEASGRSANAVKLMPGILPIVAGSRSQARDRQAELEALMLDAVSIDLLSSWAGVDLSRFPSDGPLPDLPHEAGFDGWRTWLKLVKEEANSGLTIRQLAHKIANTGSVPMFAGTAQDVADEMEAWFRAGAADGFNLMFPLLPRDWTNFMRNVMPELQRRGVAQTEYGSGTLRSRLGLARPSNQFSSRQGRTKDAAAYR